MHELTETSFSLFDCPHIKKNKHVLKLFVLCHIKHLEAHEQHVSSQSADLHCEKSISDIRYSIVVADKQPVALLVCCWLHPRGWLTDKMQKSVQLLSL